jgi:glycosyltransferase involved in cell wall biosynthesis
VYVDTKLYLAGNFSDLNLEAELQRKESWKKVVYLGFINREQYKDVLSYAKIGVVTFLPDRNHISAQPNKLFEYMSAGIPVIASNFPLWKKIVEDNECGKCVNPSDPEEIAGAIRYLLQNDQIAEKMGSNGIKMVKAKYNWEIESAKLLRFYKSMILG